MAASAAIHSCNATFSYSTLGSGVYIDIAEVIDIEGPNTQVGSTETTHLLSDDCFKEFIPGLGDGGECSLNLNMTKAVAALFYNTFPRVKYDFKITDAAGNELEFTGFLTEVSQQVPDDDRITLTATFKATGKPTYTAS